MTAEMTAEWVRRKIKKYRSIGAHSLAEMFEIMLHIVELEAQIAR